MHPSLEEESEFQKREYAAGLKHHELSCLITLKHRAGEPDQTEEERKWMLRELDLLSHPPYHHLFKFDFADALSLGNYYEIVSTLDAWFPAPDSLDLQYVEDILFSIMSPNQSEGRLHILHRDNELEEKASRVRRWIQEKANIDKVTVPTSGRNGRVKEEAYLQYISLETVKNIFASLGLGPSSSSGEWAAALTALRVKECLIAQNPYRAEDWFISVGLKGTTRRTIANQWEHTTGIDFKASAAKRMFNAVCNEVGKMMIKTSTKA